MTTTTTISDLPAEMTLADLWAEANPLPMYQEDLQIQIYEELLANARATQAHPLNYLGTLQQISALQDQARELASEAGLPRRRDLLLRVGDRSGETTTA